jgi:hypothetical protein
MLFLLSLTVRLLPRLLVLPNADDATKDLEILVLRHQLRVLRRKTGRPKFTAGDRVLLAAASRALPRERWAAFLVTPQTLLRWHRTLVRRKWTYGKERKPGRPPIDPQIAEDWRPADGLRRIRCSPARDHRHRGEIPHRGPARPARRSTHSPGRPALLRQLGTRPRPHTSHRSGWCALGVPGGSSVIGWSARWADRAGGRQVLSANSTFASRSPSAWRQAWSTCYWISSLASSKEYARLARDRR